MFLLRRHYLHLFNSTFYTYDLSYLYNSHRQSRLLRQLFPDMSRRFRRLSESRLQYLQLFCFDRRPGTPSLAATTSFVVACRRFTATGRIATSGIAAPRVTTRESVTVQRSLEEKEFVSDIVKLLM